MKTLIATLLLASIPLYASDPFEAMKKAAKEEERQLKAKMKKYGVKEQPGTRVIGVSAEYFIIDGRQVLCSDVEMKCVNGRCTLVPKK